MSTSKPRDQDAERDRRDSERGEALVEWAVQSGAATWLRAKVLQEDRRARARRLRVTSSVLLGALILGGGWFLGRPGGFNASPAAPAVRMAALHGVERLPDGTIVEQTQGTKLSVEFTPGERRVMLLSGEAHFTVTSDLARPFVVIAGGVAARAVGTAFAVSVSDGGIEVLVTEGRVAVDHAVPVASTSGGSARDSAPLAIVNAGGQVVIDPAVSSAVRPPVVPLSVAQMQRRLAWRVPRLDFNATRLAEVLPAFNRHSNARIVLGDPALGELLITGVLRADNPDSLLELLEIAFGVRTERGEHEIVLRRDPPQDSVRP